MAETACKTQVIKYSHPEKPLYGCRNGHGSLISILCGTIMTIQAIQLFVDGDYGNDYENSSQLLH
jgi:hypothetical protein